MRAVGIRIHDVAFGGCGVGRLPDGRAVFVPFVIEGESVQVELVRERRHYVEARLISVDEPSPHRVDAPCPYFGKCGGCSYQHMAAPEQERVKERQVAQALRRIGRLEAAPMEPILPSPTAYEYRNRVTVHFDERAGGIGFFAQGSRDIVDIARCWLAQPLVNAALTRLRAQRPPGAGHCTLRATEGKRSFEQTNDGAAAELLRIVSSLADGGPKTRLIDAYCGAGFFLKALRSRFAEAIGLEWDHWAVAAAEATAVPPERYVCGDVAVSLAHELGAAGLDLAGTQLICDPPSEGLNAAVCESVLRHPPAALIYVSCNPATLARDLARLRTGYRVAAIQPLDMFPQTAEIEVIAHLVAH